MPLRVRVVPDRAIAQVTAAAAEEKVAAVETDVTVVAAATDAAEPVAAPEGTDNNYRSETNKVR